jgi:glutamine amidotransferase
MPHDVVIVDYGSGNTRSMFNALMRAKRDDQRVLLSAERAAIDAAERIVLPGVGAFAECRRKLDASGTLPAVTAAVQSGRAFLGVCVGMQILADEGHEFEVCPGLGWIRGVTRQIQFPNGHEVPRRLPHVEWSPTEHRDSPLFEGVRPGELYYFVHSFILDCSDAQDIVATAEYGEVFAAAVARGNVFGCQFHPEKSADAGLHLLRNFCRWRP